MPGDAAGWSGKDRNVSYLDLSLKMYNAIFGLTCVQFVWYGDHGKDKDTGKHVLDEWLRLLQIYHTFKYDIRKDRVLQDNLIFRSMAMVQATRYFRQLLQPPNQFFLASTKYF